jgi:Major Facilitator Superfamily
MRVTTYASWHWIFFLNLPLGILALILTLLWVENIRTEEKHPFDWLTFLLAGFASTGAVYAMEKLGGEGVHWQLPGIIFALSLFSGTIAIVIARRKPTTSLIDLESLKLKTYSLSVYGASAFRIAVSVLPFLLPLMFQIAFGLNAFRSGLYLLALFAGDLSMKALVIQVLRRFGFRRILIVNGVITATSMALCATLSPTTPTVLILAILFFHGACRSMQFTCMTTLAYTEIPLSRRAEPMASSAPSCSSAWAWASLSAPSPCASSPTRTATLPPCPNSATFTLLSFSWLSWHLAPSSTASASHQTREPRPAATASLSSKSTPSESHHRACRSSASLLV